MKNLFVLAFALLLAGCVEGPPAARSPELTFTNMPLVSIDAARIDVIDNYKPPMQEPNVEHTFQPTPYAAAEQLAHSRLVAAGSENVLRVIIDDASVVREKLQVEKNFIHSFLPEPVEKLKAKLFVRFELVSPSAPDIVLGHASIAISRDRDLNNGISPAERDAATFELTEQLMNQFNSGLQTTVKNTFGKK